MRNTTLASVTYEKYVTRECDIWEIRHSRVWHMRNTSLASVTYKKYVTHQCDIWEICHSSVCHMRNTTLVSHTRNTPCTRKWKYAFHNLWSVLVPNKIPIFINNKIHYIFIACMLIWSSFTSLSQTYDIRKLIEANLQKTYRRNSFSYSKVIILNWMTVCVFFSFQFLDQSLEF